LEWTSFNWDGARTEQELTRAIQLNPSYAPAHDVYAWVLSARGRADEAIREAKKVIELDPLGMTARSHLGDAYYYAHRYPEAIQQHRSALDLYPAASEPNQDLALDYLVSQSYQNFLLQAEQWMKVCGEFSSASAAAELHRLKSAEYQQGVRVLIEQALRQRKKAYASSVWVATLYARNGEIPRSLEWLETAREERDPNLLYLAVDPAFDNARSDPRFQTLVAQVQ
jgi:tetratricopeptide (TPR) repeat protein